MPNLKIDYDIPKSIASRIRKKGKALCEEKAFTGVVEDSETCGYAAIERVKNTYDTLEDVLREYEKKLLADCRNIEIMTKKYKDFETNVAGQMKKTK